MRLLEMTVSGAAMIVVIVLIRALVINRLPKRTFFILWGMVLLRLLVPFSIASGISVYTMLDRLPSGDGSRVPALAGASGAAAAVSPLPVIWLSGVFILLLLFITAYMAGYHKFKKAVPLSGNFPASWPAGQDIRRRVRVHTSAEIAAPLTYGLFRPVILLPDHLLLQHEEQLRYILTHEMVHIRRWDALTKILLAAAVCIHWFNPLCWIMYILTNRDLEISCDEAVLRILGQSEKSAYARTLVSMEEKKLVISPIASHFSKNALEERILAILAGSRTSRVGGMVCVAVFLMAAAVFSTSSLTVKAKSFSQEADIQSGHQVIDPTNTGTALLQDRDAGPVPSSGSDGPVAEELPSVRESGESNKEEYQTEPEEEEWRLQPGTREPSGQPDSDGLDREQEQQEEAEGDFWKLQPLPDGE